MVRGTVRMVFSGPRQPGCLRLAALLTVLLFISPRAIAVAQSKASTDTQPSGAPLEAKHQSPGVAERRFLQSTEISSSLRVQLSDASLPPLLLDPPPPSTSPPSGTIPQPSSRDGAAVPDSAQPASDGCGSDANSAGMAHCDPGTDPRPAAAGSPDCGGGATVAGSHTPPRLTSPAPENSEKASVPSRDAERRFARARQRARERRSGSGAGEGAATGAGPELEPPLPPPPPRPRPITNDDGGSMPRISYKDRQMQQWATDTVLEDWEVCTAPPCPAGTSIWSFS